MRKGNSKAQKVGVTFGYKLTRRNVVVCNRQNNYLNSLHSYEATNPLPQMVSELLLLLLLLCAEDCLGTIIIDHTYVYCFFMVLMMEI